MEHRKVSMMDLDGLSDINLESVPDSVWEIELEIKSVSKSISLLNIPSNITLLNLGGLLSKSISEPFHLPMSLVTYKGPFLSNMVFPQNMETIHVIETPKSMSSSRIVFPTRAKKIIVENPLEFSGLDSINLPDSVESFEIIGKYNCSLEKLNIPLGLLHLNIGENTQPTDLLNVRSNIQFTSKSLKPQNNTRQDLDKSPLLVTSGDTRLLGALYEYKPRVDKIHVVLDDVLSTIGDVWTEVLLEGRVEVRELTLINGTGNTCLSDCSAVFNRSYRLNRKLCRNLIILCETFSYTSHLNLAKSLVDMGDISIDISYMKDGKTSPCVVPRLASILGIEKTDSGYSSNKFGVVSTSVGISAHGNLKIVIGASPTQYTTPIRESRIIPVSSSTLVPNLETEAKEPGPKTIILHTWSKCSFCAKQDDIINEFKSSSDKHMNMFNDMVEIKKIDIPEDIDDKRVDSFPTWIKDDVLIVGVQKKQKLEEMLNMI